jgi:hypothetical protein
MSLLYRGSLSGGSITTYGKTLPQSVAVVEKVFTKLEDIKDIPIDVLEQIFPDFEEEDYYAENTILYGTIKFKFDAEAEYDEKNVNIAFPFDRNNQSVPVETESVYITRVGTQYYYSKLNHNNLINYNTNPYVSRIVKTTPENSNGNSTSNGRIEEVVKTGIPNSTIDTNSSKKRKIGFQGDYFKADVKFHQLSLREGDNIFQGRFGNSIRLSGYMHEDKTDGIAYPAFMIRNGENSDNKSKKIFDIVNEDINKDGSSIHITSGEYITSYTPISANSQRYKFPEQAKGDQIIVNSDRVTLSSKGEDLYLISNRNLSMFANNIVSIDANTIDFTANDGNVRINALGNNDVIIGVSGGKVLLGADNTDNSVEANQMILGNKLINLIDRLIQAINLMTIATPSGPSAPGPIDKATFNTLAKELKDCLSSTNYLV